MRLPLKYKIILAPATVLLLLTLLLGFLQYTYWNLSVKRQQANRLKTAFIALAEADMAVKRLHALATASHPGQSERFDSQRLEQMNELHVRLAGVMELLVETADLTTVSHTQLDELVSHLKPDSAFDSEHYREAVIELRTQLNALSEQVQAQRDAMRDLHNQDMTEIVSGTALVSTIVLAAAILLGLLLSLTFARNIVRRIWTLSDSASRIARGEMVPPPAPLRPQDELDDLAISLNRMADRLIRVVSTEKLLEGAEEERRRIARDIHDQTLADLSSLQRGLQELRRCPECASAAVILEEDLRRSMATLREVMDDLHPQTLDILGLAAALQSYLERAMSREGLPEYHFYVGPGVETLSLPRQAQLSIYRVALEAVHNVVRHAQANRYEVVLEYRGDSLILSVEDNGGGFAATNPSGGRGLNNIRERALAIGAAVSWEHSRFSSGTRFELNYPIPQG